MKDQPWVMMQIKDLKNMSEMKKTDLQGREQIQKQSMQLLHKRKLLKIKRNLLMQRKKRKKQQC